MEHNNILKFIILESSKRRLLHPRIQQDPAQERVLRHKKPSAIKKCLFGKADPEDTRRLLEEQYAQDQKRFLSKFGFDIEAIENLERSSDYAKENIENDCNKQNRDALKGFARKVLKARRKVTFNKTQATMSQQFITDFYQAKKTATVAADKKAPHQQDVNSVHEPVTMDRV